MEISKQVLAKVLKTGTYRVMCNDIVSSWEETLYYSDGIKRWYFRDGITEYPAIVHEIIEIL